MSKKEIDNKYKGVVEVWNDKNAISNPSEMVKVDSVVDKLAFFFAPGDFYYYVFNFETLQMEYVHENVWDILQMKPQEFDLNLLLSFYHPEDLEKMQQKEAAAADFLLKTLPPEQLPDYKVVYLVRYKLKDGTEKKILHQAKTINASKDGKIQQVLGVHADVSHIPGPIDHKVSFIGDGDLPSYFNMDPVDMELENITDKPQFTEQELNILSLLSQGNTSKDISSRLNISDKTVNTHRQNIIKKANAKNVVEVISNLIREGVI